MGEEDAEAPAPASRGIDMDSVLSGADRSGPWVPLWAKVGVGVVLFVIAAVVVGRQVWWYWTAEEAGARVMGASEECGSGCWRYEVSFTTVDGESVRAEIKSDDPPSRTGSVLYQPGDPTDARTPGLIGPDSRGALGFGGALGGIGALVAILSVVGDRRRSAERQRIEQATDAARTPVTDEEHGALRQVSEQAQFVSDAEGYLCIVDGWVAGRATRSSESTSAFKEAVAVHRTHLRFADETEWTVWTEIPDLPTEENWRGKEVEQSTSIHSRRVSVVEGVVDGEGETEIAAARIGRRGLRTSVEADGVEYLLQEPGWRSKGGIGGGADPAPAGGFFASVRPVKERWRQTGWQVTTERELPLAVALIQWHLHLGDWVAPRNTSGGGGE